MKKIPIKTDSDFLKKMLYNIYYMSLSATIPENLSLGNRKVQM